MTYAEVLAFINLWIVTNHNNEITADVLRPVLVAILDRQNAVTGDPANLSTTDQSNLVAAINEVFALVNNGSAGGIKLHSGTDDPNVVPPVSFGWADFYIMVTAENDPVQLYQYDGFSWVTTGKIALADGTGTTVSGTGTTIDPFRVNVSGAGAIPYLTLRLKAKGVSNVGSGLETGDVVEGFKDNTEYWTSAIYNGGDISDRSNYSPIVSSSDL